MGLFLILAMCAYTVIVGDTIPVVLREMIGTKNLTPFLRFITSRRFIISLTTLGVSLPLSLYRDISKLAKTSAFAMFTIIFILFAVMIEGPKEPEELKSTPPLDFARPGLLQSIGVMSFGMSIT
jgi:sodium-coupled neutral amino acid transporter 11